MSRFRLLAPRARMRGMLACSLALAGCYHGSYHTIPVAAATRTAEELLVGRFAGAHVLHTATGGLLISIRGAGLWSADRQPLYVVDGMAVDVTPERGLDWLAPNDIARIDVLKNAAETSMYGGRGANGVVLITTKRPMRPSAP